MAGVSTGISLLPTFTSGHPLYNGLIMWLDGASTTDSYNSITPYAANSISTSSSFPVNAGLGSYMKSSHGSVRYQPPAPIDFGGSGNTFRYASTVCFWAKLNATNFTNSNDCRLVLFQDSSGTDLGFLAARQNALGTYRVFSYSTLLTGTFSTSTWYFFAYQSHPNAGGLGTSWYWGPQGSGSLTSITRNSVPANEPNSAPARIIFGDCEINNPSSGISIDMDSIGVWGGQLLSSSDITAIYNAGAGKKFSDL